MQRCLSFVQVVFSTGEQGKGWGGTHSVPHINPSVLRGRGGNSADRRASSCSQPEDGQTHSPRFHRSRPPLGSCWMPPALGGWRGSCPCPRYPFWDASHGICAKKILARSRDQADSPQVDRTARLGCCCLELGRREVAPSPCSAPAGAQREAEKPPWEIRHPACWEGRKGSTARLVRRIQEPRGAPRG